MSNIWTVVLTLVVVAWWVPAAEANSVDIKASVYGPLRPGQLYAVDVSCVSGTPHTGKKRGGPHLAIGKRTAWHYVLITEKGVPNPESLDRLPDDPLMVVRPYDFTSTRGFSYGDCEQSIVVRGGGPLHIVAAVGFSESHELNPGVTTVLNVVKGGLPLATLLLGGGGASAAGGAAVAKAIEQYITPLETMKNSANDAIATINKEQKITGAARVLKDATYSVFTPFGTGRVVVTVRPIDSLLEDPKYLYTRHFEALLTNPIPPEALKANCLRISGEFAELGIDALIDQGFGLLRLARKAGLMKEDILACLPCRAAEVLSQDDREFIWAGLDPDAQRFTKEEVLLRHGGPCGKDDLQPPYEQIEDLLLDVVGSLSRSAQTEGANVEEILGRIVDESITVIDRTSDKNFGVAGETVREAFVKALREKGVTRFGCYGPTRNVPGLSVGGDKMIAAFVGFAVNPQDPKGDYLNALMLRPHFHVADGSSEITIDSFEVSDNPARIQTLIGARTYCGRLRITRPASVGEG